MGLRPVDMNPIEMFAARYMSHFLTSNVANCHREICKVLYDKLLLRVAIEMPRGFGKSTWGSVIYPLYEVCTGDYDEIQTFSQSGGTAGLSTKWMSRIKRELTTNNPLIVDYGIKKGKSWGQDHIEIIRGDGKTVNLYCRGKLSAARGSRGLVFIDDPQDFDDCQSETVLTRDTNWFLSDIVPILLKEQRLIFIGTSISPLSLLSQVQRKEEYHVIKFAADDPIGSFKSIWPEQFPNEFLRSRYNEIGHDRFNAEYRCKPLVSGNPVFKEDQIRDYDPQSKQFRDILLDGIYTVAAMDTAISTKKINDNSAIVVVSAPLVAKPDYYIRECKAGKWGTVQGAMELMQTYQRMRQNLTFIEAACNPPDKDGFIIEVEDQCRIQNVSINHQWEHPTKSKLHRAYGVQGLFQESRVFFDTKDLDHQLLINELIMFIGDDKFPDDRVDACVHGLTKMKDWGGRKTGSPDPQIVRHAEKNIVRRGVTGGV